MCNKNININMQNFFYIYYTSQLKNGKKLELHPSCWKLLSAFSDSRRPRRLQLWTNAAATKCKGLATHLPG